ncbi:MAG TPA: aldo/keto reductase [Caulobacteraceae bacterium]|nr:aldo/keto reductase [Caulobacteraceae bacterium]
MKLVPLGRTGVEVSLAGLGCGGHSRLGMARGASKDEAAAIVRRALDLGVTFIDTAQAYGTEEAVALGIAGRRAEVFLSTKSHAGRREGQTAAEAAADLAAALDGCLRRLATDRIDLFHLHGVALSEWPHCRDVLIPELERARAAGKIRFIGLTEVFGRDPGHAMLPQALADPRIDVVMVGFNLLNPCARERVLPLTRAQGVGTLVMFAVRRALSAPAALRAAVAELIAGGQVDGDEVDRDDPLGFLEEAGVGSTVEAAYRFCAHESGVDVVLTGTGDGAHLEANLAAIQAPPLTPAVQARLARLFGKVDSLSGN